jgi:hypothetical protein
LNRSEQDLWCRPSAGRLLPAAARQSRRLIDQRIDEYRKAIAAAEAKGDVAGARVFERMTLTEQQDRRTVDGMINSLRRRFPRLHRG